MHTGSFIISLDFELFWGVRDSLSFESYQENILGVRRAIPQILSLFNKYSITCTFATVGFLFAKNKNEILHYAPTIKPAYDNPALSPYNGYMNKIGEDEESDPYHYGLSLIKQIREYGHEIGSHTFSHYFCLAKGQNIDSFRADVIACKKIAFANNLELKSFIFPKNQYKTDYLKVCQELGITAIRGNERSWLYTPTRKDNAVKRIFRLMDSYINLSGHHCYDYSYITSSEPYNIPSSRFLRPYNKKLKIFEFLKRRRIVQSMSHAAKNGLVYHLWWHPHNFGRNIEANIKILEVILQHYQHLKKQYNFNSISMGCLTEELRSYEKQ